jgi:hypothetical protein
MIATNGFLIVSNLKLEGENRVPFFHGFEITYFWIPIITTISKKKQ